MTNSFLQVTGFDPLIVSAPQGAQGPQGTISGLTIQSDSGYSPATVTNPLECFAHAGSVTDVLG